MDFRNARDLARRRNHRITHRGFYWGGDTGLDYALAKEGVNTLPEKAKRICLPVSNVGEPPPLNPSLRNSHAIPAGRRSLDLRCFSGKFVRLLPYFLGCFAITNFAILL